MYLGRKLECLRGGLYNKSFALVVTGL